MEEQNEMPIIGNEKNKMLSDFAKEEAPTVGVPQQAPVAPVAPAQTAPVAPAQTAPAQTAPAQTAKPDVNMGALPSLVSPDEVGVVSGGSKYPTKLKEEDVVVKEFMGRPTNFAKTIQTIKSVDIGQLDMKEKYARIGKAQMEGKQASEDDLKFTISEKPNIQTNILLELESGDYVVELKHIKWWFSNDGKNMSPTFNSKITQDSWYENQGSTAVDRMAFKFIEKFKLLYQIPDNFSDVEALAERLVGKKIQLFERKGSVGSNKFTKLEVYEFVE